MTDPALKRRAHRGQMTKLLNKAEAIVRKDVVGQSDIDILVSTFDNMKTKLDLLQELDEKISDAIKDAGDYENSIVEADDYATDIKEHLAKYQSYMQRITAPAAESTADTSINTQRSDTSSSSRTKKVNLPKLTLTQFSGDILQWQSFIDSFKAAIDNDEMLDNIQKFQYLKAQISGEAAKVIDGLSLTNDNYLVAMALLEERYGQPHKVRSALMKALWELPKPNGNVHSLRTFFDRLQAYIRGLDALGKREESYGDLLVPIILEKLPGSLRKILAREHGNQEWSLSDLRRYISREIDAMEADQSDISVRHDSDSDYAGLPTTAQAFYTHAAKPLQKVCVFCKGGHKSGDCTKVTDPEKRSEIARRDRRCFNCLGNHKVRECKSLNKCRVCHRKHHTALCTAGSKTEPPSDKSNPDTASQTAAASGTVHVNSLSTHEIAYKRSVLLKTAVTEVSTRSNRNPVSATILFDEGATRSFITADLAEKLAAKSEGRTNMQIAAFGNKQHHQTLDHTKITIGTKYGPPVEITALIVPSICTPIRNHVDASTLDLPHIRGLTMAQPVNAGPHSHISILIGADFYWSFVGDRVIRGNGPTAVDSKLGYLLSGPMSRDVTFPNEVAAFHVMAETTPDPLERFWEIESIGIKDPVTQDESRCDFEHFRDSYIEKRQNQYVAKLPWKNDHPPLPTNYQTSEIRTRRMVQRLPQDTLAVYDRIIREQEARGFIEHVSDDDRSSGHYLPHHGVKKDSATTPIRVVFDCSSKASTQDPSLNDCLEKGPPLLNELAGILLRFRIHAIAYISDIEKAFLHIGLHEKERNFTKFFWLTDPQNPDSNFTTYRFASVLFGSISSPAILNAVLRTHLETKDCDTARNLQRNLYVDNVASGSPTSADAIAYYQDANHIVETGGFKLRSWSSNDSKLRELAESDGVLHQDFMAPLLGMKWDTQTDKLAFKPQVYTDPGSRDITKRAVVQRVSMLYDPLGLLSPTHVMGKIFTQSLWKKKLAWDQALAPDQIQEWNDIEKELSKATDTSIPRRYFDFNASGFCELHCFVDASTKAYGATVYLRHNENTSLAIAKTRVAPVKELTLPRLELMAALLGARLTKYTERQLISDLDITLKVLWSDSQIVLSWLRSEKHLPVFVKNRVSEIQASQFNQHKYCPTKQNPADLLTRGISSDALNSSHLWWHGPPWLKDGDWPISPVYDSKIDNDEESETTENVHVANTSPVSCDGIGAVIDVTKYSSLRKLQRVSAWVLRFLRNTLNPDVKIQDDVIRASEITNANKLWIEYTQRLHYPQEFQSLSKKSNTPSTLVRQLKIFLDQDDVLRCGGRLHNAPISEDAKFPVLLPPKHAYTKLLILDAHHRTAHSGVQGTVTLLRQTYWITGIRVSVKSVIRNCFVCKRLSGPAYKQPIRAPLPDFRVLKAPPFTVTGIDFTGELYAKSDTGQGERKCYVCLFTCANTRAVHLELVKDLSVATFLRAFRRFAARRSVPQKIISDNASTYQSAAKDLKRLFTNPDIETFMTSNNVEWQFIPKRAPWWGGFYERLIGMTKNAIRKVLGRAYVTFDELECILCEVEAAINDRPITFVYSEINDAIPLTPSQLLHGRLIKTLPYERYECDDLWDPSYGNKHSPLLERNKRLSETLARLWNKWTNEYLTTLRERHGQQHKTPSTENNVKPGDIVLVHSDVKKRLRWDMAVIQSLITGNDGIARAATIKTRTGHTNRPLTKLYPLEIGVSEQSCEKEKTNTTRPTRRAALDAREKIKIFASDV